MLRFNETRRILPDVYQCTFTAQQSGLEQDGIIRRTVCPEVPLHRDYRPTEMMRGAAMKLRA